MTTDPVASDDQERMWIGFGEFDYLLGDVHSLKQKRSVVRPIVAEIRRRFEVTVAEVGHPAGAVDRHGAAQHADRVALIRPRHPISLAKSA